MADLALVLADDLIQIRSMSIDPHHAFDQTVLDQIEHSAVGAVPMTPSYQDALKRLYASHQVYASADHRDGHVTARSLVGLPSFYAENLERVRAGELDASALESNSSIFTRYVKSLPAARQAKAEALRLTVAGRPAHHRKHAGAEAVHDPIHTLFLAPGSGPHPGLPGNYLYGSALQLSANADARWAVHVHDAEDSLAVFEAATMAEVFAKVMEIAESAPFTMSELSAFGFRMT
jgi:hypothetical protein